MFLRISAVKAETGYRSQTTVYLRVKRGLLTKPIPLGERSVGWPDHEVRAINAARIAGKSDDEIRELVKVLHAERIARFEAMTRSVAA